MGAKKFTDIELIAALDFHNGNVTRVAEELGVSKTAVIKRKRKIPEGVITPDIDTFRQERANIFASIQQALLRYVTPDKLKRASLAQIGTLFGIMYDKERIERNQATDFIAHAHYQMLAPEQMKSIKAVAKELTEQKLKQVTYGDSE
jgi:predicted transcriptional regulator